ncbi:MAG: hypothetical protein Q9169_004455 [Polycauliona sp. 2 TL-2023]
MSIAVLGLNKQASELRSKVLVLEMELNQAKAATKQAEEYLVLATAEKASLHKRMDFNSFVLVLIDGDCMPFHDYLPRNLEAGGEEAAGLLKNEIYTYIEDSLPHIQLEQEMLVRIYINLRGLRKLYRSRGLFKDDISDGLGRFITGFNKKFPNFDIVDAGNGKEGADSKIKTMFELFIYNAHCKQILLGGPTDNGYARLLGQYNTDNAGRKKIRLIKGPPFTSKMGRLADTFGYFSVPKVFRDSKIPPPRHDSGRTMSHKSPYTAARGSSSPFEAEYSKDVFAPTVEYKSAMKRPISIQESKACAREFVLEISRRHYCNEYHLRGFCNNFYRSYRHGSPLTNVEQIALRKLAGKLPCLAGEECIDQGCYMDH